MRLHANNPELTDDELTDLAMRGTPKPIAKDEIRYDFTCYKCGGEYKVNQEMYDWIQSRERTPKCGHCYL